MRKPLLLFFLICLTPAGQSQQIAAENATSPLLQARRIAFHTDRTTYSPADTIWFTAYCFNGNNPETASTNLYVDLIDEEGQPIASKKLPILGGIAIGDFPLNDSMTHGFYFLRGYHKGMMDEGNKYGALQPIAFINPSHSRPAYLRPWSPEPKLNVFPEGGNFVLGLTNNLFLFATDQTGTGMKTAGLVLNQKGDTMTTFQTGSEGLTSFPLRPEAGQEYRAEVQLPDGTKRTYLFPAAKPDGLLLRAAENSRGIVFQVQATETTSTPKILKLAGRMYNRLVFQEELKLDENRTAGGIIPIAQLPPGLLQLGVIDPSNNKVLALRPVFVYKKDIQTAVQLRVDTLALSKKGYNVWSISLPDSVEATVSISIECIEEPEVLPPSDLVTNVLWNAEKSISLNLAGPSLVNDSIRVKMLNDWRLQTESLASWLEPAPSSTPEESYLSITGDVFKEGTNKPQTSGELVFIVHTRDSTMSMLHTDIRKDGSFTLDELIFEDMAKFDYKLAGKRPAPVEIKLRAAESELPAPAPIIPTILSRLPLSKLNLLDSIRLKNYVENNRRVIDEAEGKLMGEVKVVARVKRPVDIVNKKYTTGLFSNMDASIFDFVNEPAKPGSQRILDYLTGKIAGLHIERRGINYTVTSTRAMSITGGLIPVQIFLNEMPVMADELLSLTVADVALVKFFKAGSNMMAGFGIAGKLAIYTLAAEDVYYNDRYPHAFSYRGYNIADLFSSPDYSTRTSTAPDNRSTVYWNPACRISEGQKEFTFRFYNSDKGKKLRINVQGCTQNGRLISFQQIVQ